MLTDGCAHDERPLDHEEPLLLVLVVVRLELAPGSKS
jgi:hypothetical protein